MIAKDNVKGYFGVAHRITTTLWYGPDCSGQHWLWCYGGIHWKGGWPILGWSAAHGHQLILGQVVDHHVLQWETWTIHRSMKAIALEVGILNAKYDIES